MKNNLPFTETFPSFFLLPSILPIVGDDYALWPSWPVLVCLHTSCTICCCLHGARELLTLVFDSRSDDQKRVHVPVALLTSGIWIESLMGQQLKLHKFRAIITLHTRGQKGSTLYIFSYIACRKVERLCVCVVTWISLPRHAIFQRDRNENVARRIRWYKSNNFLSRAKVIDSVKFKWNMIIDEVKTENEERYSVIKIAKTLNRSGKVMMDLLKDRDN